MDRSKRMWLKRVTCVAGSGALGLISRGAFAADAPQKAAKTLVKYQDFPKDAQMCANCRFFIRPAGMDGRGMMGGGMMGGGMMAGTCQVVEGPVSPRGYCLLYAPPAPG